MITYKQRCYSLSTKPTLYREYYLPPVITNFVECLAYIPPPGVELHIIDVEFAALNIQKKVFVDIVISF